MLIDWHTLWTIRNGERHGRDKKAQRINRLAQLERDLISIYQFEPEVLASGKDLLDTPINELLTLPPDGIHKWITSRRPIILQSRREVRCHSTCNVQLLPTYIHPLCQSKPKRPAHPIISQEPNPTPTANTLITSFMPRIPTNPIRRHLPARPSMKSLRLVQAPFEFLNFPTYVIPITAQSIPQLISTTSLPVYAPLLGEGKIANNLINILFYLLYLDQRGKSSMKP
jgi:hypothetical protein